MKDVGRRQEASKYRDEKDALERSRTMGEYKILTSKGSTILTGTRQ
jgi:hypothetical protein